MSQDLACPFPWLLQSYDYFATVKEHTQGDQGMEEYAQGCGCQVISTLFSGWDNAVSSIKFVLFYD